VNILFQRVVEGQQIPTLCRICWIDHTRKCFVVAPIGLHLIAKLARRAWILSYGYSPNAFEKIVAEAWQAGFDEGRKLGAHEGRTGLIREVLEEAARQPGEKE